MSEEIRVIDLGSLSDKKVEEMEDPHEQSIVVGTVQGTICVSFMDNGKAVFSFNQSDDFQLTAKRIVAWMSTQSNGACAGWIRLMDKMRDQIGFNRQ